MDAGEHFQDHLGGGHGAPVLPAVKKRDAAPSRTTQPTRMEDPLGANGLGGTIVHADPLGGVDDLDLRTPASVAHRESAAQGVVERGTEDLLRANQVDAHIEMARGQDSPANLGFGGLVGTHGIDSDIDRHLGGRLLRSWFSWLP